MTQTTTQKNLEMFVTNAVKDTGKFIKSAAFDLGKVETKLVNDKPDDFVTWIDKSAEERFKKYILTEINANFIGEEYGQEDNGADITFYIDPIDGTKSFVKGDFDSSVAIGVEEKGELIGGWVYDFMRDIMYVGFEGESKLIVSGEEREIYRPTLLTKNTIALDTRDLSNWKYFNEHPEWSINVRSGSIALGLAQLAAGNYDVSILTPHTKAFPWDVAAAQYLLSIGDFTMKDYYGDELKLENPRKGMVLYHNKLKGSDLEERLEEHFKEVRS